MSGYGMTPRSAAYWRNRRHEAFDPHGWSRHLDERAARLEASAHYVYRAWDECGLLLYIGCTVNLGSRMSNHRIQAPWWSYVTDLTVQAFPSRSEARAAEEWAIESEGSYFNATRGDVYDSQARRVASRHHPEWTSLELDTKYPALTGETRTARYLAARESEAVA